MNRLQLVKLDSSKSSIFSYESKFDSSIQSIQEETPNTNSKSNKLEAAFNIINSNLGASVLAIPFGMKYCGLGYGILLLALTSLIMIYGVKKLIKVSNLIDKSDLYYADLVDIVFGKNYVSAAAAGMLLLSMFYILYYDQKKLASTQHYASFTDTQTQSVGIKYFDITGIPNFLEIVLLNIPYDSVASFLAKISFAFGLLLGYPVQAFPIYTVVEKWLLKKKLQKNHNSSQFMTQQQVDNKEQLKIYFCRIMVMFSVFLVSYLVPQFVGLLNFIGSISGILVQFIIPIFIYHRIFDEIPLKVKILDYSIIIISLVALIICGYFSAINLIKSS
ncbi:hypothetical protein PPERSA_04388 [Pseudocohnilembus persalinus]|uniref:Amino acid transporter transmembrane domain-containing protein n=1 Tax=Pseudocohnilembus persalinus TaxID=266149 RepID=A0A0V0QQX8_PSEPJ|nr:hypothetical protein PPERSA_04388 [Pseudocohnilembus persalinus]|eukprot:KRX04573.1 hypothetical protein PPERSA_04388 [Pseudocohnilembus persalinus]